MTSAPHIVGFEPILPRRPKALVLGSMPSVASLQKHEYYGHPANLFWPIMAAIFGFAHSAPYAERTRALRDGGVALWDVLHACEREGSADSAIAPASEVANAIDDLLASRRTLKTVLLNGGKAHSAFRKHIVPKLADEPRERLRIVRLPSTSPANASVSRAEKTERWTAALRLAVRDA